MIRTGNERTGSANITVPVAASTVLKENTIAVINESGYAAPGSKAENLTAAGRVEAPADNSSGADGDVSAEIRRGVFVWDNDGSINKTHILKPCYIAGETSVTITKDGASPAGIILAVEPDGVTVDMTHYIPAEASEAV